MTKAISSTPSEMSSVDELMELAYMMEKEAASRYRELAARMRLRNEAPLAALFEFLSEIEEKHANQLSHGSSELIGHAPDPARIRWDLPENFDEESASSRLLTPYGALAIAVRNEERAFAFYCYVAAGTGDQRLRSVAEDLAKQELDHASLLRRERRKAFRKENRIGRPQPESAVPDTVGDLLDLAFNLESRAAVYHRILADRLRHPNRREAEIFAHAAEDEAAAAKEISQQRGIVRREPEAPASEAPNVEDGLRLIEMAFERYVDIAERARREDVVQEAQRLAERAVHRLALAQGSLGNRLIG